MSKWTRTGYDYIPVAGEEYHPQGKPTASTVKTDTVVSETADSKLVRSPSGELVITDKQGNRRSS